MHSLLQVAIYVSPNMPLNMTFSCLCQSQGMLLVLISNQPNKKNAKLSNVRHFL